ncbi:AarF/ABC1/UbiB kinase family protein [Candidatus Woesearchaeota archaeon]|nr:AarF/ABC1/UbiB kinase family protein [Candidatus Woesearchaeota archaeon]
MSLKESFQEINRFRQILDVFFKEGFGYMIYKAGLRNQISLNFRMGSKSEIKDSVPIRIRRAMEELGGTFIKLGQLLSLRQDLIPIEYAKEFSRLQDQVPSFSYGEVIAIIEQDLNKKLSEIFLKFEKEPIASASIGQVHVAWLKTGEKVAVKVMRPGIEQLFETDIKILYQIAGIIEKHYPELKDYDFLNIVKEFERYTKNELNYVKEANNINIFYNNFKGDRYIVIPNVYLNYTTKRVLVMDFIDGKKIDEAEEKERKKAVQLVVNAVLKQIFEFRVFHADPHPGNIFILKNGKVSFLDFGIVGRISELEIYHAENLFMALAFGNRELLAESLINLGAVEKSIDIEQLKRDLSQHGRDYYDITLDQLNFKNFLNDIIVLARKYRIKLIPDFVLLIKSAATLEGFAKEMDPQYNFVEAWKKYARNIMEKRKSLSYKKKFVKKNLYEFAKLMNELPRDIKSFLSSHEHMKVDMDEKAISKITFKLDSAMNRIALGIVIGALLIAAAITPVKSEGILNIRMLYIFVAIILGTYLIRSIAKEKEV